MGCVGKRSKSHGSSQVLSGRVGSGQEDFKYHGSGRVALTQSDRRHRREVICAVKSAGDDPVKTAYGGDIRSRLAQVLVQSRTCGSSRVRPRYYKINRQSSRIGLCFCDYLTHGKGRLDPPKQKKVGKHIFPTYAST